MNPDLGGRALGQRGPRLPGEVPGAWKAGPTRAGGRTGRGRESDRLFLTRDSSLPVTPLPLGSGTCGTSSLEALFAAQGAGLTRPAGPKP